MSNLGINCIVEIVHLHFSMMENQCLLKNMYFG